MQENSRIVFLIVCAIAEQNWFNCPRKESGKKHMFVVEENER